MGDLKQTLKTIIPHSTYSSFKKLFSARQIRNWEKQGRPAPPPHVIKQKVILDFQKQSGYNTLVETGTFMGDMIEAQRNNFKRLYSIELNTEFHKRAQKVFSRYKHITILQGDSAKELLNIVKELKEPAIFWLDGHYSSGDTARGEKNCPIYEELTSIFDHSDIKNHIMLIDDANHFNGTDDYPTIEALTDFIKQKKPSYKVSVLHNIICVTP